MNLRGHRPSDVISAVFLPASLLLYINLILLSPSTPPLHNNDLETPDVQRVAGDLNLTEQANPNVLLITPLLRCASTSLLNLLTLLAPKNGFTMPKRSKRKTELVHVPDVKIQKEFVQNISRIENPSVCVSPLAYINFTQYGEVKPIRVSIIRDPVERAISWYYHSRAPYHLVERQAAFPDTRLPSRNFLKKDLESCLRTKNDWECRWAQGKQLLGHTVEFFCGHQEICTLFGDSRGLEMAKYNVDKSWSVIGVVEEWNKTLTVLSHYIPMYFNDATKLYYEKLHGNKIRTNTNFYKPSVDPEAKNILKKNFAIEYEFYEFIKQRLDKQYRALIAQPDL